MVYTILSKYIPCIFPYKKKRVKKPLSLIITNINDTPDARDANNPNNIKDINLAYNTTIPYEELWRSAIRCKLIHGNCTDIYDLWMMANNPQLQEEILPSIDEAYIQELRGVSLPVSFQTTGDHLDIPISIQLWYREKTIYMTFRIDKNVEAKIIKKHMSLHNIVDNICVNRFFYRRLLSVIKDIILYFEEFKEDNYTLVLSGYSSSAVMAQIASAIFARIFPNMYVKCHTFGSPKPGNRSFAKWFLNIVKENYRVVYGNDPIVFIPTDCNWKHPMNTTLHFDRELHVNITYHDIPWYKRFFLMRKIIKKLMIDGSNHNDHNFDKYISHLWKYKRMTSYLYSTSEADVFIQTPL